MQRTYFRTFVFACSKSTSLRSETTLQLFNFHSNPTNRDTQIDALLSKVGKLIHVLRMCKKYGYSLDSLHQLFHSLIIPLFIYGILVWGVASYYKYLSKIGKFQGRVVRFGFIKGAPAHFKPSRARGLRQEVVDLRASQILLRAFWQISSHPVKQDCETRGHWYVLPFKLGLNVLNAVLVTVDGLFSFIYTK